MQKTRLQLTDTTKDVFVKMSEGNIGALTVLGKILNEGHVIDPYGFMGGMTIILNMDSQGIYGPRIWGLYKDVCREDIVRTIAMTRAVQLGLLDKDTLDFAINNRGVGLDVDENLAKVLVELEEFWKDGREDFLKSRK